jgi:hypothetical protein
VCVSKQKLKTFPGKGLLSTTFCFTTRLCGPPGMGFQCADSSRAASARRRSQSEKRGRSSPTTRLPTECTSASWKRLSSMMCMDTGSLPLASAAAAISDSHSTTWQLRYDPTAKLMIPLAR